MSCVRVNPRLARRGVREAQTRMTELCTQSVQLLQSTQYEEASDLLERPLISVIACCLKVCCEGPAKDD